LRTIAYIDGYNLYYGLLRKSQYKWLDVYALFRDQALNQSSDLVEVRYYTAPMLGKMSDDLESPIRQRRCLQALRKMHPIGLTLIEGRIVASTPFQRLIRPIPEAPHLQKVQVLDFNEKKTDVNIASDMINGAWLKTYDQAVLCSNDSDLEGALRSIKEHHPHIRIGLVAPISGDDPRKISSDLARFSDWKKILSTTHLSRSQLPDRIPSSHLAKPTAWKN
jgi:uncharacterized LabA/DUF88 family protein